MRHSTSLLKTRSKHLTCSRGLEASQDPGTSNAPGPSGPSRIPGVGARPAAGHGNARRARRAPAPAGPTAARQRRPLGRAHSHSHAHAAPAPPCSGRRRQPSPDSRGEGRPRPGQLAVLHQAPAPPRAAPPPSWRLPPAPRLLKTRGGAAAAAAGGAPADPRRGALTACHCQAGCGSGQAGRAARRGQVGRAGRVPYLALGWGNGSSAELRGSPPRRRGQARNRAPPSSFPVATPPSPARTRGKAGAGGFTPGTSASAWPSLSLSSSPLQPPVTPPGPGLKTSPVSVRLSPQPPRS
nr:translation initiation factor IF-2-like [Chlorocebus sabaeus]